MKKENIVDFKEYQFKEENITQHAASSVVMSDELELAIQHLIHRLRELGPIVG